MSRVEKGYAAYIQRLKEEWQAAEPGEPLNRLLANTVGYLEAASELTRDELALVSEAVRRDLHALAAARGGYRDSAFFNALKESVWSWLLELADRPQLEWQSVQDELRHKGSYQSGDYMGLGVLICDKCGHQRQILYPERIAACLECGGKQFHREPMAP